MDDPNIDIAPTLFLAYTDITATASRALFSLEGDRKYQTLKIPILEDAAPACIHSPSTAVTKNSPPMDVVQLISCRYAEKRKPQYTFLIINTRVACDRSHYIAKAVVDLCAKRNVMKLAVCSTQRLDIDLPSKLFENTFGGMLPVTQRHALSGDTLITDAFLSNLIQLCTVEGQPFTLVTAPAHRVTPGQANAQDGSLQLIRLFQNTITDYSGLMFSEKVATSLVYHDSGDDSHEGSMYA